PLDEPTVEVVSEQRIDYTYEPGLALSLFLRGLGEGRIEGGRCRVCDLVYVPPRAACPVCGSRPMEPIAIDDRGTVVNYTFVHLPVQGIELDLPFAVAWIQLDGTDVPFPHLLGDVAPDDVTVG